MNRRGQNDGGQDEAMNAMRTGHALLLYLCSILATPLWLIMRRVGTMGSRFITWHFLAGIGVLFFMVGMTAPVEPVQPGVVACGFLVAMMALHHWHRDRKTHSRYVGRSLLGSSDKVFTLWEPLAFAAVGAVVLFLYKPLGLFMLASAFSSHLFHRHLDARDAARLRAMNDAAIEQEVYMEAFRRKRSE